MNVSHEKIDARADEDTEFGFWLYLMSDAVLFSLIFATFVVMSSNLAGGPSGAILFDINNLAAQTSLLLISSLTIAMAHRAAVIGHVGIAVAWMVATTILGAGFIWLELREMAELIANHAGPGRSGYWSAFFTLVGTHGLHVSAGLIWAVTVIAQLLTKGNDPRVLSRLSRLTLFWHFLDIVWIGVFSLVYLPELI